MSYASVDNVKSMFRCLDDSVTDPALTNAEIQEFIDEACATIDGCIGEIYQLPITEIDNPKSFLILKKLTRMKVASVVDDILNDYAEADKKPMWGKQAKMLLEKICPPKKGNCQRCEPSMKLPDAEFIGVNIPGDTIKVKATTGVNFRKNRDDW